MSLAETINALRETNARLNTLSDELGDALNLVEIRMQQAGVPFPVWLNERRHPLLASGEARSDVVGGVEQTYLLGWRLGYVKLQRGIWGFAAYQAKAILTPEIAEVADSEIMPLSSTPRYVRLAAAPFIPLLCKELLAKAEEMCSQLQEVHDFLKLED